MSKPILVDYQRAQWPSLAIEIQQEGETLTILVPPPSQWRSVLHATISGICVSVGLATVSILIIAMRGQPLFITIMLVGILVGFLAGGLLSLIKLVQIASRGGRPVRILVSDEALEIRPPSAFIARSRHWFRPAIRDLSVREAGLFRAFERRLRLQVILSEERIDDVLLPWNGQGSLALVENQLRDALRLPPAAALNA